MKSIFQFEKLEFIKKQMSNTYSKDSRYKVSLKKVMTSFQCEKTKQSNLI